MLRAGWTGRRFFKIYNPQKEKISYDSEEQNFNRVQEGSNDTLLEIIIKPREFYDLDCKMMIVRNISHISRQEKLKTEYSY